MAATVRSTNQFVATINVTSGTVVLPAGYQTNDVVYLFCQLTAATGVLTAPGGYTVVVASFSAASSTSCVHAVFRKVMTSSETDPAVTCTSGRLVVEAVAVQGADTTTPEDVAGASDTNSAVTYPSVRAASVTTVTDSCLLLTGNGVRNSTNGATTTFTTPSGMTEVNDQSTAVAASSNAALEVNSLALGAAGATGTKTATAASSSGTLTDMTGSTVAVRPLATATVSGSTFSLMGV